MRLPFLLSCILLSTSACSSSGDAVRPVVDDAAPSQPDAGDARVADAAAKDTATSRDTSPSTSSEEASAPVDAPVACNALANAAPVVSIDQVASDPPAPLGGSISDGTYTLTSAAIYTGPTGPAGAAGSEQVTIQITGSTLEVSDDGTPATRTVTLSTSGTSFTTTDTCPDTTVATGSYTATASTLVLELDGGTDDAGARTVLATFTKQ
jgi:hypothetical protein